MNFNENDHWRDKTELLNLGLSKLPSAKVLLKLEFDTKHQVLFSIYVIIHFSAVSNTVYSSTPQL